LGAVADRGDYFIDQVLPLATTTEDGDLDDFLGSCFRIGGHGYAITAAHLLEDASSRLCVVVREGEADERSGWEPHKVTAWEAHPEEDVAVIRIDGLPWRTLLRLDEGNAIQATPYRQFAYPWDVAHELIAEGRVQVRPDLIYAEGYVRREMTNIPVPAIRGSHLFELSTAVGSGASGSPVIRKASGMYDVIGVYIGQRVTEGEDPVRLGYAARADGFRDWTPDVLEGRTVLSESRSGGDRPPAEHAE
jgi:hypothetical protein